ncbi:MAG: hypothetical protein SNH79_03535 [Rikenellaceae bacterium]
MEQYQSNYDLVGGITKVVVHPTGATLPALEEGGAEQSSGVRVEIEERGSSYVESREMQDGQYCVRHTLTFVTQHGNGPFTNAQLERALNEGVVADVTLATGATIRVGWSEKHGVEAPLHLQSVAFESGERGVDLPLKKWIWESVDITPLL